MIQGTMPLVELERARRRTELELREQITARRELIKQAHGYARQIWKNKELLRTLQEAMAQSRTINTQISSAPGSVVMRCPTEGCQGRLTSTEGSRCSRCSACDAQVCKDCGVHIDDSSHKDHVCKADDVDTIRLLNESTRSCPACATPIHKAEGCDQMFCTRCACVFDYKTGRRVRAGDGEPLHNPHFFDWLAANPQAAHDYQNGRLANVHQAMLATLDTQDLQVQRRTRLLADLERIDDNVSVTTHPVLRLPYVLLTHVARTVLPVLDAQLGGDHHRATRISFVLGDVDEKSFKAALYKQHRLDQRITSTRRELIDMCETLAECLLSVGPASSTTDCNRLFQQAQHAAQKANLNTANAARLLGTDKAKFYVVDPDTWEFKATSNASSNANKKRSLTECIEHNRIFGSV